MVFEQQVPKRRATLPFDENAKVFHYGHVAAEANPVCQHTRRVDDQEVGPDSLGWQRAGKEGTDKKSSAGSNDFGCYTECRPRAQLLDGTAHIGRQ